MISRGTKATKQKINILHYYIRYERFNRKKDKVSTTSDSLDTSWKWSAIHTLENKGCSSKDKHNCSMHTTSVMWMTNNLKPTKYYRLVAISSSYQLLGLMWCLRQTLDPALKMVWCPSQARREMMEWCFHLPSHHMLSMRWMYRWPAFYVCVHVDCWTRSIKDNEYWFWWTGNGSNLLECGFLQYPSDLQDAREWWHRDTVCVRMFVREVRSDQHWMLHDNAEHWFSHFE